MADTRQTNHSALTVLEGLRALFAGYPFPGHDLVWLVDELVHLIQHGESITLTMVGEGEARCLVATAPAAPGQELRLAQVRPSVFRSMLARVAVMASDETGTEVHPYGGHYVLTRSSRSGPIRLEIDFTNTPSSQRLSILRAAVTATPSPPNAAAPVPTGPQPLPTL
jgi:hypothetical protein